MSENRASDLNDVEYVGELVEPEENVKQFRPAAKVGKSELDLRRIHRRSTKAPSTLRLGQRSVHNLARSKSIRLLTRAKSSVFPRYSTTMRDMTITPTNSAELLRAEEIKMELLNRQREMEFNLAKKYWDRFKMSIRPGKIDFKPEQFEEVFDDECRNSARDPEEIVFQDYADVSRDPSYSKLDLPYDMKCLNRYRENMRKYEMQFRYELEMLGEMQSTAYEAARFALFLGPQALQKKNYSPKTVKFTPKERQRLDFLLREEQR